jgi:hypothetical protein
MQYLLSEKEYIELVQNKDKRTDKEKEKLQSFCTVVANKLPVKFWGNKDARIWNCILTENNEHYCDECPSQEVCPCDHKQWSK